MGYILAKKLEIIPVLPLMLIDVPKEALEDVELALFPVKVLENPLEIEFLFIHA